MLGAGSDKRTSVRRRRLWYKNIGMRPNSNIVFMFLPYYLKFCRGTSFAMVLPAPRCVHKIIWVARVLSSLGTPKVRPLFCAEHQRGLCTVLYIQLQCLCSGFTLDCDTHAFVRRHLWWKYLLIFNCFQKTVKWQLAEGTSPIFVHCRSVNCMALAAQKVLYFMGNPLVTAQRLGRQESNQEATSRKSFREIWLYRPKA